MHDAIVSTSPRRALRPAAKSSRYGAPSQGRTSPSPVHEAVRSADASHQRSHSAAPVARGSSGRHPRARAARDSGSADLGRARPGIPQTAPPRRSPGPAAGAACSARPRRPRRRGRAACDRRGTWRRSSQGRAPATTPRPRAQGGVPKAPALARSRGLGPPPSTRRPASRAPCR